jgi:hypothetical protein
MLKILKKVDEFELLKKEILELVDRVGFQGPYKNQIICQSLTEGVEDWQTGIGRIEELEIQKEQEYKHLQPSLKGTKIENIINEFSAFRSRILVMQPRSCYSVHSDPTPRIHIPIVVNSGCWMVWPNHQQCHHLMPGLIYQTNTTKSHTFINGGDDIRIHLVLCVDI